MDHSTSLMNWYAMLLCDMWKGGCVGSSTVGLGQSQLLLQRMTMILSLGSAQTIGKGHPLSFACAAGCVVLTRPCPQACSNVACDLLQVHRVPDHDRWVHQL